MRANLSLLAGLLSLTATVVSDVTWPASTDELEEIMYQLYGFNARLFADNVTPCTKEASGPGRQNAAEWLRVAFHDMATANPYFGLGGIDSSLMFELNNGENTGPGHNTTLQTYANYLSSRSSMSDLIALGTYASVRSCGGPIIPIKGGRIDATSAGSPGVPQPQNAISIFISQFSRMGFTQTEMIQLTACGHTLGGVHSPEFPALVPPGSATNDEAALDTTPGAFDNNVVTEYLDGTTKNPLVVGPSVALKQNSDFVVFNSDNNATMQGLRDAAVFKSTCGTLFQRMIDVVPSGVTLSAAITPYTVKPVNMQLTLNTGGSTMLLTGYIRVRTTTLTQAISTVTLTYKNRNGASSCGGSCSTTAIVTGTTRGFDDSFEFFPISTSIPTATGISSFTVTVTLADGTTQTYDNNGNSYPISDAVFIQKPQSCLLQGTGALTVSALVRNDRTSLPVNVTVTYKTARTGIAAPKLNTASIALTKGNCVGAYTFYSTSYTITGGMSSLAKLDIVSGSGTDVVSDSFKAASDLAGTCATYSGSAACGSVTVSSVIPSSTLATVTTTSSIAPTATLEHKSKIGGYNLVSCWTEGTGVRALSGAAFAYDGMTLETCMSNCTGFAYWGTEYGRECYCGNTLASSSSSAPLADCNMVCGGNPLEYCGAGNRLELYLTSTASLPSSTSSTVASSSTLATSTSSTVASSSTSKPISSSVSSTVGTSTSTIVSSSTSTSTSAAPTGTLGIKPIIGKYSFVGCWTEGTGVRALSASTYADDAMTLESCAAFCSAYKYFGTEYGRECYCGDTLAASSASAPVADCNMICAGSPLQYCGAGNRLELYSVAAASSSSSTGGLSSRGISSSTSSSAPITSSSSSVAPSSSKPSSTTSSSTLISSSSAAPSSSKLSSTTSSVISSTSSTRPPTTTSSSVPVSSTKTSSSSSTVTTLAHRPTISPYSFVGCWTEGTGSRALAGAAYTNNTAMTLESCAAFCSNFKYFGTEYGQECYCGNTLSSSSAAAPLADCSMTCSGNPLEYCGAGNRLELYVNNASTSTGPTQPSNVGTAWTWYGCQTEATTGRALSSVSYAADTMTLESCASFCDGFDYFGVEYARECYCGNTFGAGSVNAPPSDCSMTCAANSNEYCGAGNRLSVYYKAQSKRRGY